MERLSSFQKFLVLLFVGAIFFYAWNGLAESDIFYHLRAGRLIWETKAIPHTDVFSYTAEGRQWITHEWLAELLFYGAYAAAGLWGLIACVAALGALAYFILIRTALAGKANVYFALFIAFLLGYLTFGLWIPRPQAFAFLSFSVLLWFLERYRRAHSLQGGRLNGVCGTGNLVGAAGVMWFWANANASFILGLVVLAFYFLAESAKRRFPSLGAPLGKQTAARLAWTALAATVLSFINPNGYLVFFYSAYVAPAVRTLGILEWKSILFFISQPQTLLLIAEVGSVAVWLVWWRGIRRESRDVTVLGLVLGVSFLPFISIRHIGFWPLAVIPAVAVSLSEACPRPAPAKGARAAGLLVGFAVLAARLPLLPARPVDAARVPVEAVDFFEAHGLRGPIFNLYNEGGYLEWRLWPREKVFVDGRSEVFAGAPLNDLLTIVKRAPGWEGLVDRKYGINTFFLPYVPPSLAEDTAPLSFALEERGFHLVFWDDTAMLLVRDTFATHDFVEYYGLRSINPFRDPAAITGDEAKEAAVEIRSLLDRAPESKNVQAYARRFLAAH